MNADRERLFEELTPRPGGPERFAQRLDTELASIALRASRRRPATMAAACAALAVLIVLAGVFWTRDPGAPQGVLVAELPPVEVYNAPAFDRLLGRPSQRTELSVTVGAETAPVTQLETANEKVRIYQIQ